jgi:DNA-binding NarL/FixJ family response regulator
MLLIDWELLPNSPTAALDELRKACPAALVIVLISHLDARQQAALSAGADAFISKVRRPNVWQNACAPLPQVFVLDDHSG